MAIFNSFLPDAQSKMCLALRRAMFTARVRIFQASWESAFPLPVPFSRIPIESMAENFLGALSTTGLTADQISLNKINDLYGYELRFPMFRGNATYSLNAQRVRLEFMNAVGPTDVTTIIDTILKCLLPISFPPGTKHHASVGRQCEFVSSGDFAEFFSPDGSKADLSAVKQAGAIFYVLLPEWPSEVVVTLDRSILISGGIWVHTRSYFDTPEIVNEEQSPDKSPTVEALRLLSDVFEKAVGKCNLQLTWS
jgi:hypothetical protein